MHRSVHMSLHVSRVDYDHVDALTEFLRDRFATDADETDPVYAGYDESDNTYRTFYVTLSCDTTTPGDWGVFTRALFDEIATITPAHCRLELGELGRAPDAVFTNYPLDLRQPCAMNRSPSRSTVSDEREQVKEELARARAEASASEWTTREELNYWMQPDSTWASADAVTTDLVYWRGARKRFRTYWEANS